MTYKMGIDRFGHVRATCVKYRDFEIQRETHINAAFVVWPRAMGVAGLVFDTEADVDEFCAAVKQAMQMLRDRQKDEGQPPPKG